MQGDSLPKDLERELVDAGVVAPGAGEQEPDGTVDASSAFASTIGTDEGEPRPARDPRLEKIWKAYGVSRGVGYKLGGFKARAFDLHDPESAVAYSELINEIWASKDMVFEEEGPTMTVGPNGSVHCLLMVRWWIMKPIPASSVDRKGVDEVQSNKEHEKRS